MRCYSCQSQMAARRMECGECGIAIEGEFATPRLARLQPDDQQLMESFVLCGGNLKHLAESLSVSYPTLRKRIDGLIDRLRALRAADQKQAEAWLTDVESGRTNAEEAARLLRELAHG